MGFLNFLISILKGKEILKKSSDNYFHKESTYIGKSKSICKRNKLDLSNKKVTFQGNIYKKYLYFLIFISFIIIPISSYYEIKIELIDSRDSRLLDIQNREPNYYCRQSNCDNFADSNYFKKENNILYAKGEISSYLFKWNNMPSLKGMFKYSSNIKSIEFINFGSFSSITDVSEIFLNCSSLKQINFGSASSKFKNAKDMSFMFTNCSSIEEIDISSFDISLVTNMDSMFKGCFKLISLKLPTMKTPYLTNMARMFQSCSSIKTLPLSNFDTSSVTFMNDLFHDCFSLNTLSITNFNTEKVIKMESMFQNCKSLTTIDLKNFYTPSLRQLHNMFYGCVSVKSIVISKFDTFQITNFANLFYNCSLLNKITNIENLVTDMVKNMSHMFYNCSSLPSLDLSKYNTKRVIDMKSMFKGCSSIATLNIKNLANTKVEDMSEMFYGCFKLKTLTISNFKTDKVKNMKGMFSGCSSLDTLILTSFATTKVTTMNSMFYGCNSLKKIDISNFTTSQVTDMNSMFYNCSNLLELNINKFDTSKVKNIDSMFYNCRSLKSLYLLNFKTQNMESMKAVFSGCISIENLDLSNFNTKNVLYMDSLFNDCNSLIKLDLGNFNVNKVKSMSAMFRGCKSLTSIILPNFSKLSVTNTSYMFSKFSSLVEIDLSNFDSSHIIDMDYMFSNSIYFKEIHLRNWTTKEVRTMNYLFNGCSSLTSIDISFFDTPKLESITGMFYGCTSLKIVDLTRFNTANVIYMDFLFYKDFSLKSIIFMKNSIYNRNLNEEQSPNIYFKTSQVKTMRYMFAYCYNLVSLDLSFMESTNVLDASHMFTYCENLTFIDLSSFDSKKVVNMENMFYNCSNLIYINLNNMDTRNINNYNKILDETPINMVFCIDNIKANKIKQLIINQKGDCAAYHCGVDFLRFKKKIISEENGNTECGYSCKSQNKFNYLFNCYDSCPNGTYPELGETEDDDDECKPLESRFVCTIQYVFLDIGNCTMEKLEKPYNNTNILKNDLIVEIKKELPTFELILPIIYKDGSFSKTVYNETYHFSILSNKKMYKNLTYIDFQDCEYLLKKYHNIDANEDVILFTIEYLREEYRIPIIEYTFFNKNGTEELNASICQHLNFTYYIPAHINLSEDFKYDFESEYNNEICFPYTTENKTDIILFERRKEFNTHNMSICENGCSYRGHQSNKVLCECPAKINFNKFLLDDEAGNNELISRFKTNNFESFNFGVLKCFKLMFTKENIEKNFGSIIYIAILIFNVLSLLLIFLKFYKNLFIQVKLLSETKPKKTILRKDNKNINVMKNDKNKNIIKKDKIIITKDNNPPKKENKILTKPPIDLNHSNNLIDSKSKFDIQIGKNSLKLDKNLKNKNKIKNNQSEKSDMEINMLSYLEAKRNDKRGCFFIYLSFIKTRHLLICLFFEDLNPLLLKISFFLFTSGICLGINTIFFDDKVLQIIYEAKGFYDILNHIIDNIILIIISGIIALIIKSIVTFFSFTDVSVLKVVEKTDNIIEKDEKMEQAYDEITFRIARFYIISIILMGFFWFYVGSFCVVFINSQLYLIINAIISLMVIIILQFFYYIIPSTFRTVALNGKDNSSLYKFSQAAGLI